MMDFSSSSPCALTATGRLLLEDEALEVNRIRAPRVKKRNISITQMRAQERKISLFACATANGGLFIRAISFLIEINVHADQNCSASFS